MGVRLSADARFVLGFFPPQGVLKGHSAAMVETSKGTFIVFVYITEFLTKIIQSVQQIYD